MVGTHKKSSSIKIFYAVTIELNFQFFKLIDYSDILNLIGYNIRNSIYYNIKTMAKLWTKENILSGVHLPGRILDIPSLKENLIDIFLSKTHKSITSYAVLLGQHILDYTQYPSSEIINSAITINIKWQNGAAHFQDGRNIAGNILAFAREEKNKVNATVLRIMAQIANTPHVARHALIASDYAIKLVNIMHPLDMEEVKKERLLQIEMMSGV